MQGWVGMTISVKPWDPSPVGVGGTFPLATAVQMAIGISLTFPKRRTLLDNILLVLQVCKMNGGNYAELWELCSQIHRVLPDCRLLVLINCCCMQKYSGKTSSSAQLNEWKASHCRQKGAPTSHLFLWPQIQPKGRRALAVSELRQSSPLDRLQTREPVWSSG